MELQTNKLSSEVIEKLALGGDVSGLTRDEKVQYYRSLCERVGLDSATQPFKLLKLQGKEIFYCDRSGAQQLSRLHNVSHEVRAREVVNDCYVVTVRASSNGRATESIGAVPIINLKGEALCNAYMKAETKAKRRATLDLLGLGMLDETEVGTIPGAKTVELELPPAKVPAQVQPAEPPIAHRNPPVTQYSMKAAEVMKPMVATDKTRAWMLTNITQFATPDLLRFAAQDGFVIEKLIDWPLDRVPTSKAALSDLIRSIEDWQALNAEAAGEPPVEHAEAFWDVAISVPRAGSKRAEYLQNPDTIRSLYDAMKQGDEKSRTRLFGMANEWSPAPYTATDGKVWQPRQEDHACRAALDQFLKWEENKKMTEHHEQEMAEDNVAHEYRKA